jgi:hypothetical protein
MIMEVKDYINIGFLLVAVIVTLVNAFRGGATPDPLSLALKIVTDAEQMFIPRGDETWDDANRRKLQYALAKMKDSYPALDVVLITNLIERAVDVLKARYTTSVASSRGATSAQSPDRFSQF